jgi:hypothetical protein
MALRLSLDRCIFKRGGSKEGCDLLRPGSEGIRVE